jgi:hypothetical protein
MITMSIETFFTSCLLWYQLKFVHELISHKWKASQQSSSLKKFHNCVSYAHFVLQIKRMLIKVSLLRSIKKTCISLVTIINIIIVIDGSCRWPKLDWRLKDRSCNDDSRQWHSEIDVLFDLCVLYNWLRSRWRHTSFHKLWQ